MCESHKNTRIASVINHIFKILYKSFVSSGYVLIFFFFFKSKNLFYFGKKNVLKRLIEIFKILEMTHAAIVVQTNKLWKSSISKGANRFLYTLNMKWKIKKCLILGKKLFVLSKIDFNCVSKVFLGKTTKVRKAKANKLEIFLNKFSWF